MLCLGESQSVTLHVVSQDMSASTELYKFYEVPDQLLDTCTYYTGGVV